MFTGGGAGSKGLALPPGIWSKPTPSTLKLNNPEEHPMKLTREAILNIEALPREEVPVPEWGGSVFVRTMTGEEKDAFEESNFAEPDEKGNREFRLWDNYRARLVATVVCDEHGQRLFTVEDVPALAKKSSVALDRIMDAAKRLNAISKSDIDDLVKNSSGETI
jgi:hypothetical protein